MKKNLITLKMKKKKKNQKKARSKWKDEDEESKDAEIIKESKCKINKIEIIEKQQKGNEIRKISKNEIKETSD